MTKPITFGKLEVDVVSTLEESRSVPEPETPFRIAVLGDFSGRANRGVFEPVGAKLSRPPLLVDRDNFDVVLEKLGVEIHLPLGGDTGPTVTIRFNELDDFHPDHIYERVEVFQALRKTRRKLGDPRTFETAAREVRSLSGETAEGVAPPSEPEATRTETTTPKTGGLLDQIIDETHCSSPGTGTTLSSSGWNAFLQRIVKPHLVPNTDPRQEELMACVDEAVAELMRTLLHHPDFQAIEAAWRGLNFLVSRLETDSDLKLYLFDMSKDELAADLGAAEDLQSTATYKLLVEQTLETFGAERWTLLAGNYTFNPTCEDAELLGRLAKIACRSGSRFFSAAGPLLLGCESLADTPDPNDWTVLPDKQIAQVWESLIRLPEASCVSLALPRFLLRLPYGSETDPIERFEFEEMPGDPVHGDYLWGNPAFGCAYLLAQTCSRRGSEPMPGAIQEIDGLPLHVYKEQGETRLKPCAEVLLTEKAMEKILDKGLMPLLSMKNKDVVRLARFQSLADPATSLAGRWC